MNKKKEDDLFCNNCGKYGHLFHICKIPITSLGVICFRINEIGIIEYLMIRRKETLGFIDFMRAKFSIYQKYYIVNMLKQMTTTEKQLLLEKSNSINTKEPTTYLKDKIVQLIKGVKTESGEYNLNDLIDESNNYSRWEEPEWGFPKGRRNGEESDYDCAIREFSEETGYSKVSLKNIRNIVPIEETFTGSNYNSYRHKYYLMYISFKDSVKHHDYQKSEVSKIEWKNFEECINSIRPYNLEKKQLLININNCLNTVGIFTT